MTMLKNTKQKNSQTPITMIEEIKDIIGEYVDKKTTEKILKEIQKLEDLETEACNVAKAFVEDQDVLDFDTVLQESSFDGYHAAAVQDLDNTPEGRIYITTVKDETELEFVIHLWRNKDLDDLKDI